MRNYAEWGEQMQENSVLAITSKKRNATTDNTIFFT